MRCPNCGAEVNPGDKYCVYCGFALNNDSFPENYNKSPEKKPRKILYILPVLLFVLLIGIGAGTFFLLHSKTNNLKQNSSKADGNSKQDQKEQDKKKDKYLLGCTYYDHGDISAQVYYNYDDKGNYLGHDVYTPTSDNNYNIRHSSKAILDDDGNRIAEITNDPCGHMIYRSYSNEYMDPITNAMFLRLKDDEYDTFLFEYDITQKCNSCVSVNTGGDVELFSKYSLNYDESSGNTKYEQSLVYQDDHYSDEENYALSPVVITLEGNLKNSENDTFNINYYNNIYAPENDPAIIKKEEINNELVISFIHDLGHSLKFYYNADGSMKESCEGHFEDDGSFEEYEKVVYTYGSLKDQKNDPLYQELSSTYISYWELEELGEYGLDDLGGFWIAYKGIREGQSNFTNWESYEKDLCDSLDIPFMNDIRFTYIDPRSAYLSGYAGGLLCGISVNPHTDTVDITKTDEDIYCYDEWYNYDPDTKQFKLEDTDVYQYIKYVPEDDELEVSWKGNILRYRRMENPDEFFHLQLK